MWRIQWSLRGSWCISFLFQNNTSGLKFLSSSVCMSAVSCTNSCIFLLLTLKSLFSSSILLWISFSSSLFLFSASFLFFFLSFSSFFLSFFSLFLCSFSRFFFRFIWSFLSFSSCFSAFLSAFFSSLISFQNEKHKD